MQNVLREAMYDDVVKEGIKIVVAVETEKAERKAFVASGKPVKAGKKLIAIKEKGEISKAQAKKYLPPNIKGCSIEKETDWHQRWKGFYPRATPPYSHSAKLSLGERESMLVVLRWIWNEHVLATGKMCPFDLRGDAALS
jgi:hypothetical protein